MDIQATASSVLKYIGGESNVTSFTHCATRLRFVVKDESKVNFEELKKVDGVLKVINNYQIQIVIGNEVTDVFNEIQKLGKFEGVSETSEVKKDNNQKISDRILGFLVGIFAPLVPAVTGAGLLKALLILFSNFGLVSKDASTYQMLLGLADATFYFVPVLVAVTTAEKMNVNKIVALGTVVPLVFPNIVTMLAEGTALFGMGVTKIQYSSQVFPAVLAVVFMSYVYKFFEKHSPKALKSFLVPLMSYVVTFIVTLFVLGPLGFYVGEILSAVVVFLYGHLGFVGVALCGIIYPIAVATGMHKAFLPYLINSMSTIGYEIMWASASLCHNIAESGAMYGIALRTKDPEIRSKAIANGVSAMLGITEPALYSFTLVNKKVMTAVMIGGGISGAYAGFVALKCFATASPGILTLPIYSSPTDPANFIQAIAVTVIAMLSTTVVSFIMWKDPEKDNADKANI